MRDFQHDDLEEYKKLNITSAEEDASHNSEEETKEYKTIATTSLVTVVAYLLGMDESTMKTHYEEHNHDLMEDLKKNKEATIIRYLCRLRTCLMQNFRQTDNEMLFNLGNIDRMDWFHKDEILALRKWGIETVQVNFRADKYNELFCGLIADHIDDCRSLFPDWVNFEYVRDLFVVPKYKKPSVLKEEYNTYKANINSYPFQIYLHWNPGDFGNILFNDGKFLTVIYEQHGEEFHDRTKYRDAVEGTKKSIYEFIDQSLRVILVVDCENSDVFKLYSVLKNLDEVETAKIEKIVLYDDYHTSDAWDYLEKFIHVPVEHVEVERVTDRKSLVDLRMTAGICKAYYRDGVTSFILCSSDSDFWGVISALPDVDFLVLYEYSKCGKEIKDALSLRAIYHCAMDDFYSGNSDALKKIVLRKSLEREAENIVGKNAFEVAKKVHERNHIEYTDSEINTFYEKYVRSMRLKIDADGCFYVDIVK